MRRGRGGGEERTGMRERRGKKEEEEGSCIHE